MEWAFVANTLFLLKMKIVYLLLIYIFEFLDEKVIILDLKYGKIDK